MTDEAIKGLKKIFIIKWIIYVSMVISIFIYFMVTIIMKREGFNPIIDRQNIAFMMRNIFAGISAVFLFISFFIRRNITDPVKFLEMLKKRSLREDFVERYISNIDNEDVKRIGNVIILSNTVDIICWALCEAVAILGLMLFFLSSNLFYVYAFGGIALLAMAAQRPNFAAFIAIAQEALETEKRDEIKDDIE